MGPDLDLKGKEEVSVEISPVKENGDTYKLKEEKMMTCASNCEDKTFDMVALPNELMRATNGNEDVEINITDCTNFGQKVLYDSGYQDATESSSSFGDTDSGIGSGAASSDVEAESCFRDDNTSALGFDGLGDLFQMRKKKLTPNWKRFIRPLSWRCKWVELQLRELQSQEVKYKREVSEWNQRKQQELEKLISEDLPVKSVPTFCQNQRVNIMRRKKRKRVEEKVNTASYMEHHSVFSYYANKRPFADSADMDDDCSNPVALENNSIFSNDELGVDGEWPLLEFKDGNSFEGILKRIEETQSQVHQLRAQIDKVISENPGKFVSLDNYGLLAQSDALMSYTPNPEFPRTNGEFQRGTLNTSSLHISENKAGDQVMPESAVSSFGEVTPLPDMIESTDQPSVGPSCEKVEDRALLYNSSIKQELHNVEEVGIQPMPIGETQVPFEVKAEVVPQALDLKPESSGKRTVPNEQPTVRLRSLSKAVAPKNKRKRGRRKARSSRWSRKSSG
ncbi:hypothetical protein Ancab_037225 [Ancistrocladus abbreviatus]